MRFSAVYFGSNTRNQLGILALALLLLTGCATNPNENLVPPQEHLDRVFGPMQVGTVTREDVLIRLGLPSAQFEGERILTYQLVADLQTGTWVIRAPQRDFQSGFRAWDNLTCSLVLVFDDAGILERSSLVMPYGYEQKEK